MRFFDVHVTGISELYTSAQLFGPGGELEPLPVSVTDRRPNWDRGVITDRAAQTIASWWHSPDEPYSTRLSTMGRLDRYATLDNFGTVEQCETAEDKAALLALGRWIDARKASAPSSVRSCVCYTCFDLVVGTVGAVCHACTEWGCDPTEDNNECNVIPDDASTEEECPAWETGRLSPESANHANRAAIFHPASDPDTHPALEVAGVLVFAYFDESGTLRVSVHLDGAEAGATDAMGCVPIRVDVGDTTVFSA